MGPMTRKTSGWEVRLYEQIEAARGRPFAWGSHDCATWAADIVASLTETTSIADQWRGKYKTARGAAGRMKRFGCNSYTEAATKFYGSPLPAPTFAQRGDLVAGPADEIGVCIGAQAAFIGPEGLYVRPLTACATAWRI